MPAGNSRGRGMGDDPRHHRTGLRAAGPALFWAQPFVLLLGAIVFGPVGYALGGDAHGAVVGIVVGWPCLANLWVVDES
jgi:hypothetical protein